ncbi:hypothetical protein ACHAWF_011176 [Thalassiosira exigua]
MVPPSLSMRQVAVSASAAVLATAWIYYHCTYKKKSLSSNTDDENASPGDGVVELGSREEEMEGSGSMIQREIYISRNGQSDGQENGTLAREGDRLQSCGTITIAYCSTTGTCAGFAKRLHQELLHRINQGATSASHRVVQLVQVSEVDWWDELVNNENEANTEDTIPHDAGPPILLFVLPTWTNGTLPPNSETLLQSLEEISTDWRVAPEPLRSSDPSTQLKVGAFGMGSSAYDAKTVGKPAKEVFATLVGKLGARPLVSKNVGNGNRSEGKKSKSLMIGDSEVGDAEVVFEKWMNGISSSIFPSSLDSGNNVGRGRGKIKATTNTKESQQCSDVKGESECACKSSDDAANSNVGCCSETHPTTREDEDPKETHPKTPEDEDSATDSFSDSDYDSEGEDLVDLEDMGDIMKKQSTTMQSKGPQEMVTPKQAKALKKEGYKLIGTHSAVKLCRWTKHQLRGRGGCYKHTHYGITSYQCMEATPSLACANKCVFCWRHHKNPVGKEWRWKTDDPKMIVEEAVSMHIDMIKETKGIPGIQMDRWTEAHRVRHCALSLVGEPIMYPRINELLQELHSRKISTFLVTNGQHPQAIDSLIPITQLYVSVDASTPESLEAVDRPLFRDAWDRLKTSLACLKHKGQRTVARLTVVKGWNSDEIGGYAKLIALGHCSFVEVKGVTFCGKSDASNLNMTNTPWHHEVVEFSKTLLEELKAIRLEGGDDPLPEYDLACEHKHSCSVLLARVDQFAVPDPENPSKRKWRTWIDYDKFQELASKHSQDPAFKFGVEDYVADTPAWALFGADEEGFDPTDNRHRKKKKHPKYTKFNEEGIPTHDTFGVALGTDEISRLQSLMEEKKRQVGDSTTVTELHGGEKIIDDASLMFRGLVVSR